ncbi:VirB4 family type IV secretion system protein [Paraburkholderia youngii]|uniref:VirB4 family type IV secretion system protein n=1 Tax=Paraburkholderia youngii TaxID=2782701 RepID=UPI003D1FC0D3
MLTSSAGTVPFYKDKSQKERPLQEIVPWMDYITDTLILNKDGSLLAGFRYEGLDPDNIDDHRIDHTTEQLERAISTNFDERITLWWSTMRRRDDGYIESEFTNPVSGELDQAYSVPFRSGRFYKVEHWLFVLYTGNTGVANFSERVGQLINEEGMNPVVAFSKALFGSVSVNTAFLQDSKQLAMNIRMFEQILAGFIGSTPGLTYHRLGMGAFDQALFRILNAASQEQRIERPIESMLDSYLPANEVVAGEDVIRFTGNRGDRYAAVYGIKEWPSASNPMMMERLLSSDNEMLVTQIVRCLSREASVKVLSDVRNFHKMTRFSLFQTVMAKATGKQADPIAGKNALYLQCEEALARLNSGGPNSAYVNFSVMLFNRDHHQLEQQCAEVERIMSEGRLLAIRERMNLVPTYASMLPGQWAFQTRYHLMGVDNIADMAPIYTMSPGPRFHPYFSEVFKKKMPPLAVFVDSYGGKYHFNPHVGQVGHAFVIAPTESGKTTLVSFLLSQFQKYPNANTFVFDRDHSCRIVTELHGGSHQDYAAGDMKLNPFALDDGTQYGRTWIRNFIVKLLDSSGYTCTPADLEQIDDRVRFLLENRANYKLSLSSFAAQVSGRLEEALGEWLKGRPYDIFDNEEDTFELSNWTTIEMREIAKTPKLMDMFMEYAFRRIDMRLTGKEVTFIYLEEASFLLQNAKFAETIADWLKTFRKKNAFLWLTIQSPDAIDGAVRSSLVDNIKTTILMYNYKYETHRDYYKKNFGLSDALINRIGRLRQKREYMVVQDNFTRVFQTAFSPDSLNYLRSEAQLQAVYKRVQAETGGRPGWHREYLAQAAQFKNMEFQDAEA